MLTGEVQLKDCNIVYDAGNSLNPLLDVGQVEGAFVMGLGEYLQELLAYDSHGTMVSVGTWEYKPPFPLDIPETMKTAFLKDSPNPAPMTTLSSKATGEPSLSAAQCAFFAIKHAIGSARSDAGLSGPFRLPAPATRSVIADLCGTTTAMMTLS